jgi:hypothetical protein
MKNLFITLIIYTFSASLFANEFKIRNDSEFNPSLANRFGFTAGANPNFQNLSAISNFNLSYARKRESYWLDFNLQIANGLFNKMTSNNPVATGLSNNQLIDTKASHVSLGIGMMLESNLTQNIFSVANVYETTTAYLTYNQYKVDSLTDSFNGPGIICKFSLLKRSSEFLSYGLNLNYLLAVVKAPVTNTERSSSRSLTLSYLTLGFDLIFTL